jgi:hypothetical protein
MYRSSGMHWWPWLLLIGFFIPILNLLCIVIFDIFAIIWLWKLMVAANKPGWWALLTLIPVVGIIVLMIAAWSN